MEFSFLTQMLDCKQGGDPCCCVQRQVALTHGPVTVKPQTKRTDEHGSFCFEANPLIYLCTAILACLFPVVFCRDIRSWELKEMILCHVNIFIQSLSLCFPEWPHTSLSLILRKSMLLCAGFSQVPPGEYRVTPLTTTAESAAGLIFSPPHMDITLTGPFLDASFKQVLVSQSLSVFTSAVSYP